MSRTCMSKTGDFSGAHVISVKRRDAVAAIPPVYYALPRKGDIIIYNVKVPFCDKRTTFKTEKRGCIRVTEIYRSILMGISYQLVPGSEEPVCSKVALQINDFRTGNILFVRASKPVYSNNYQYDDWKLQRADTLTGMIESLHPYLQEISMEANIGNHKMALNY